MSPTEPVKLVCPVCRHSPVKSMVPSPRGAYCLCEACGHMWQEEGLLLTSRGSSNQFNRRKTDRRGPTDSLRCAHCGQIDERHELRWRELIDRIADLETENALLRSSAIAFGELAERLNLRVRNDRRSGLERRAEPRTTPDRRAENSGR